MRKAKIYRPTKTPMQSGKAKSNIWIFEFDTSDSGINPLTGWETSNDTMSEVRLEFTSKENAIKYAQKNNVKYHIVEPQKKKIIKKSYASNFLKDK